MCEPVTLGNAAEARGVALGRWPLGDMFWGDLAVFGAGLGGVAAGMDREEGGLCCEYCGGIPTEGLPAPFWRCCWPLTSMVNMLGSMEML